MGRPVAMRTEARTRHFLAAGFALLFVLLLPGRAQAAYLPQANWGSGDLSTPSGIDVDALDNVYVAGFGPHRVKKYSPDGEQLSGAGAANSHFDEPSDVAGNRLTNDV